MDLPEEGQPLSVCQGNEEYVLDNVFYVTLPASDVL